MNPNTLRTIERAHALTAWLATASLIVVAISLLRPRTTRRTQLGLSIGAFTLIAGTSALGLSLEEAFRGRLRQRLFAASTTLGWLFERKQHLAFGAIALSITGLLSLLALRRAQALSNRRLAPLALATQLAFGASALFALLTSLAGALVARKVMF